MKVTFTLFAAILFLSIPSSLFSQTIKMQELSARNDLQAPLIGEPLDKKAKTKSAKWVAFYARYNAEFKKAKTKSLINKNWLDDVEVKWDMLYKPEGASDKLSNYYQTSKTVKYTGVGEGPHTAVILIHPRTLKRYFLEGKSAFMRGLKLRVTIKVNGKTIKEATRYFENGKEVKSSPKYDKAFTAEGAFPLKKALLNRNETPFILTQTEYLDEIVKERN